MSPGTRAPILSRRSLLALGIFGVGATAAGCTLNNPYATHRTPAAEAMADLAPDVRLAVAGASALHEAATAVSRTGARFPGLVGRLDGFAALHAAHLGALTDAVPDRVDVTRAPSTYAVPAAQHAALAGVLALENRLHDTLVGQSMQAESGEFARLLGAMAAGVSQQLAVVVR